MNATKIEIANENNKLHCDAFVQIGPEPGKLTDAAFEKVYAIDVDGETRFYKLADYYRLRFIDVGSCFTIPACGLESHEWRARERQNNLNLTDDTKMAIYYFKRHQQQ